MAASGAGAHGSHASALKSGPFGRTPDERLDRRGSGDRFGGGEVAALADVEQAARRVENFLAMAAAHAAVVRREQVRVAAGKRFRSEGSGLPAPY